MGSPKKTTPVDEIEILIKDFWITTASTITVSDLPDDERDDVINAATCRQGEVALQIAVTPSVYVRHIAEKVKVLERLMDRGDREFNNLIIEMLLASVRADAEVLS